MPPAACRAALAITLPLIAGGAILAVGVAIGIVLVTSLRNETVVLTVSP